MNKPDAEVASFASQFPELGTKPLPIDEFFSPEYYRLEKEKIFKKCWLRIGEIADIPNVGDYFVKELEVCDTSLVITRAEDGKVRAFHNMCSHRGNRVAYDKCGHTKSFKCRFHSWTYGLDGKLIHLPEPGLFPDFDQKEHGLAEVACDTWEGQIFINVDPEPNQSLRQYIGEEIYTGYDGVFSQFKRVMKIEVDVNCNWKIFLDAFLETYHFSTVHALSAGDIINSEENPHGMLADVRLTGPHRQVSAKANGQHKLTLPERVARDYSGGATLAADPDDVGGTGHPPAAQVNRLKLETWATDILVLFPMCDLQAQRGHFITQDFWPLAHDKTRWSFRLHMRTPETAAEDIAVEFNRVFNRDALREDVNNMEMVQSMLSSGAKKNMQLGDQEILVRHNYKVVADYVGYGYES